MLAVPKIVPLVTRTVFANVPAVVPDVNTPVAPIDPPPAVTVQTGVNATTLPAASFATAVNVWAVLVPSVAVGGVTTIVAIGPTVTLTVANADMPAFVTLMVLA